MLFLAGLISVSFFFFKQKTAYEIRPCDWSSDVCSSDLNMSADAQVALGTALDAVLKRDGALAAQVIAGGGILDLHLESVEDAVARGHLGRKGTVPLEHGVQGRSERDLGVGRHGEELRLEPRELVVEMAVNPGPRPRGQPTLVGRPVHPNLPVM